MLYHWNTEEYSIEKVSIFQDGALLYSHTDERTRESKEAPLEMTGKSENEKEGRVEKQTNINWGA